MFDLRQTGRIMFDLRQCFNVDTGKLYKRFCLHKKLAHLKGVKKCSRPDTSKVTQ